LRGATAQYAVKCDASLRLEGRESLRRAAPESDLVSGGDKLRHRGSAAGTASNHGNLPHSKPAPIL